MWQNCFTLQIATGWNAEGLLLYCCSDNVLKLIHSLYLPEGPDVDLVIRVLFRPEWWSLWRHCCIARKVSIGTAWWWMGFLCICQPLILFHSVWKQFSQEHREKMRNEIIGLSVKHKLLSCLLFYFGSLTLLSFQVTCPSTCLPIGPIGCLALIVSSCVPLPCVWL